MNGNMIKSPLLIFSLCVILASCQPKSAEETGNLSLQFSVQVNQQEVGYHILNYTNEAGNLYQVDEVRFFVSAVKLLRSDGEIFVVNDSDGIHYFDSDIPSSKLWRISDQFPMGEYDSITFVFGLPPELNHTGFFVNPPENNMAWPDVLGGGYHYMQINGKWLSANDSIRPFNLHTGIGQLYVNGQVAQFVDNSFEVRLALNSLKIRGGEGSTRTIVMHLDNWMRSPHTYDFDVMGGAIMQNQQAQQMLRENACDVFEITN